MKHSLNTPKLRKITNELVIGYYMSLLAKDNKLKFICVVLPYSLLMEYHLKYRPS